MNVEELREKFESDLKHMQETCLHKKLSKWMDYMWAPGHFGLPVKVCLHCGKIIKTKKSAPLITKVTKVMQNARNEFKPTRGLKE